jgi:hypothetical protein
VAENVAHSRDERLLAALLEGLTVPQAAARAGVPERTARRRVSRPEFVARLDQARKGVDAVLAAQLLDDAIVGRRVLRQLAEDEKTPPSVRRAAAMALVDLAQSASARDVAVRVEELERRERERREAIA